MCCPVPRNSTAVCERVDLGGRWRLVREVSSWDGARELSDDARDIVTGALRYCVASGQFYRSDAWALEQHAPFAMSVQEEVETTTALQPAQADALSHANDQPNVTELHESPLAYTVRAGAEGVVGTHIPSASAALEQAPSGETSLVPEEGRGLHHTCASGGMLGGGDDRDARKPAGDDSQIANATTCRFASTWDALLKAGTPMTFSHALVQSPARTSLPWQLNLMAWAELREDPTLWGQAEAAEIQAIAEAWELLPQLKANGVALSPAKFAARVDAARRQALRGVMMVGQNWQHDGLVGLTMLESFTPGVTASSGLEEFKEECMNMSKDILKAVISKIDTDFESAHTMAWGLPVSVRRCLVADFNREH